MKQFSEKMIDILNYGALNLAMGIGYRNRIFDRLEELDRPATRSEIADATGLAPRYLKEWLGVMVMGGIVALSRSASGDDLYTLPREHAAYLTRKSGNNNLGVYTQEIPLLTACAMDAVNRGFETGEGIPFSTYPEFQQFMSELADAKHREVLVDTFLPAVQKGELVARLNQGITVCDLGCGQGVALNLMAATYPQSTFVGMDNHDAAILRARKDAQDQGLSNATYHIIDAATIAGNVSWQDRFDYIIAFDAIHDQSHPLEALKSCRYMLAPGGCFSMVDIKAATDQADNLDHPMGPFLYTVSLMHCMPIGLNDNGAGLGMMWGREQAEDMLRQAGFDHVDVIEMAHDAFNLHFFCQVP